MELLNVVPWDIVVSYALTFVFGLSVVAPFALKAGKVSKELKEFFAEVEEDLADSKLTKDELREIIKEAVDIVKVLK